MKHNVFFKKIFHSLIHSEDTTVCERIFGYLLGPSLTAMVYSGIAGTYLTQFYTDVLGISGIFLAMMPLVSKLFSSVISLLIGRMIDCTKTAQGKARPWILGSGAFLTICGILLYAVPQASHKIQIAWIVISYNLFFSLAYSAYSLGHGLMVPLSTRNAEQRDTLAMLTTTGTSMVPGMLVTVVMPLVVQQIGVGAGAQSSWLSVMSALSALTIPAVLMEYYFTRERVTETSVSQASEDNDILTGCIPFKQQVTACFNDKNWRMIIAFTFILQLCGGLSTSSMLYYCNWVLGDSINSGAAKQILVNMIGQAPMGIGIPLLWALVRKSGKRKVSIVGFFLAAVGSFLVLTSNRNMPMALIGLLIKSIGTLPTYVMTAFLAEALDHVEQKHGFRADGFTASVNGISQTVVTGLIQTILLAGISFLGYIMPESASQVITQPETVLIFFRWCFAGIPMAGYAACSVIMIFYSQKQR